MEESEEGGQARIFNPQKDWAKEGTLNYFIRHRDATNQAREGYIYGQLIPPEIEKQFNRVKGLSQMISVQRDMILHSLSTVRTKCEYEWKRKNLTEEDQLKNPFNQQKNDYYELKFLREVLEEAEGDIRKAEKTKKKDDDYLNNYNDCGETKWVLTIKYFEMLKGLEDSYEEIEKIMTKYKILSSGIEENEIKTYKEQEQEAIRRVVDA